MKTVFNRTTLLTLLMLSGCVSAPPRVLVERTACWQVPAAPARPRGTRVSGAVTGRRHEGVSGAAVPGPEPPSASGGPRAYDFCVMKDTEYFL